VRHLLDLIVTYTQGTAQGIPPSIICRIFLLGVRDTASFAKPYQLHRFCASLVEIFLTSHQRYIFTVSVADALTDFRAVEERALVNFFGEEYENYRRRVSTNIPFIR
jgi:protein-S-isoprenylcysteine O-methyltransferase Ste14